MRNKKGVSPLLAAVLLIAFSIVLAAIVSNFVIKKTKEFKPEVIAEDSVYCDSVSLGYKIDSANYGLEGNNLITGIVLVNKGTFSVYQLLINTPGLPSITVRLLDNDNKEIPIYPSDNTSTEEKENEYPIGKLQIGSGPEIKIIPIIKDSDTGNFVKCPNKELTIELLGLAGGNVQALENIILNGQPLSVTENVDSDSDSLTNLEEVILGTDPTTSNTIKDTDGNDVLPEDANSDGIEDIIEISVVTQVIETTSPIGIPKDDVE